MLKEKAIFKLPPYIVEKLSVVLPYMQKAMRMFIAEDHDHIKANKRTDGLSVLTLSFIGARRGKSEESRWIYEPKPRRVLAVEYPDGRRGCCLGL